MNLYANFTEFVLCQDNVGSIDRRDAIWELIVGEQYQIEVFNLFIRHIHYSVLNSSGYEG